MASKGGRPKKYGIFFVTFAIRRQLPAPPPTRQGSWRFHKNEKAKKNAPKKEEKKLGVAVVLLANVFFGGWEMSEFGGGKCPNFGGGKCPPGK